MTGQPYDAPRPDHTCHRHPAGSRTCYNRCECRCRTCCDAATRWQAHQTAGHHQRVPGDLVLAHIARLNHAGMTNPDIAHHAHISPATISNLAAGRTHSMNRAAATAILNVQPATSRHGWIDATTAPPSHPCSASTRAASNASGAAKSPSCTPPSPPASTRPTGPST